MNNRMCEMFGIDVPIFAFSHCRDVVAEVSKAGGLGVLGMARMSPPRVGETQMDRRPYRWQALRHRHPDADNLPGSGGSFDPNTCFCEAGAVRA